MSMKRTKKATNSKGSQAEGSLGFNPPPAGLPKLEEVIAEKADSDFTDYAPSRTFVRGELVNHAKFGKGYVIGVDTTRAEILFAEGLKKLAHSAT
jgi:hypothetical protein